MTSNPAHQPVPSPDETDNNGSGLIFYTLQPAIIIAVLSIWYFYGDQPLTYVAVLVGVQLLLGSLEYWIPARPDWSHDLKEKSGFVAVLVIVFILAGLVSEGYVNVLMGPLDAARQAWGMDIWPHDAPLLVQVLMVFLLSELMWYWLHRAEHRWTFIWRASGHGSHHAFKKLGAINFGLNHPFEAFFLVLPSILIELTFGVGIAAAGAAILIGSQASIAHTNILLNSKGIGWLFTTNRYHIHHHSVVLHESNTNYGCAAILWDRVFGTFEDLPTSETGTGPTDPSLWEKVMMPFIEPVDTATAPPRTISEAR